MENDIAAVGGVDSMESPQRMMLDTLTQDTAVSQAQASNFSQMAEDALGAALSNPDTLNNHESMRDSIVSPTAGAVGDERSGIVSDVSRPGVENTAQTSPDELQNQLVDRSRDLYTDLTVYNVAWSVAMRMQKDISQLLRGS